jgi:hypothetical protein
MKNYKIILSLSLIALVSSCTRDLTSLNEDPKNPPVVFSYSLFTNAEKNLARTLASSNVNLNIFRLITQYWQETTYLGESRYDLNTRNIPSNAWQALYRDVIKDLEAARSLIPRDVKDPAVQKNQIAQLDILEVYAYYYLVTTYGNIPYTKAMNIDSVFPKYDDAKTVYNDLMRRLDADIAALDPAIAGFGSADIIYGSDINAWLRFANSFKMKMALTIADDDPGKAATAAQQAVQAGIFTSNAHNAKFVFKASPPNTNPLWEDLVQSGRKDFVANSTIIYYMDSLHDSRMPLYFTVDATGGYSGGNPGESSSYGKFSKPDEKLVNPEYPHTLLDYAEVKFLLAEARARGFSVGGSAEQHYEDAITASFLDWGASATDAADYLAQDEVNWATAGGDFRQKIGIQKWIALYNRGWDSWLEWKRFDYPQLQPAYKANSEIPVRFTYPVNEQNYNTRNWEEAAAALGGDGDVVETKLWYDKF